MNGDGFGVGACDLLVTFAAGVIFLSIRLVRLCV